MEKREYTAFKKEIKGSMLCLMESVFMAGLLVVAGDLAAAWNEINVRCSLFLLAIAAFTGIFYILFRGKTKRVLKTLAFLMVLVIAVLAALYICWKTFSDSAAFDGVDNGRAGLYAGHKVMLIVPHQDDDINVLGGVMEEYVRYGSELYPVFVTNGDRHGLAEQRFQEALDVFSYIGVPQENVIFLGYGDSWKAGGPHLYNAPSGVVVESAYGRVQTYGTKAKGVWQNGVDYTVDNLLGDMQSVIETIRPDVIYCSDYDSHMDHKATTLAFDKVMGRILHENRDYRPLVLKGYAYNTAWLAQPDFFGINVSSTQNVFAAPYNQTPAVYRWEERVRMPVGDYTLSRSLPSSEIYHTLKLYASQKAQFHAPQIINGDKVFWYRDTNSQCFDAHIAVSSGNGALLNDFMLIENQELTCIERQPYDGVWVPTDEERIAEVTFPEKRDVLQVQLYDNPDPEHNVRAGVIVFDNGTEVGFGPLDPGGAAVTVETAQTGVGGFTVILTDTEGQNAGLTEIEAFDCMSGHNLCFVKVMDQQENFIYDYWIQEDPCEYLAVYTLGLTDEQKQNLSLEWDNQRCGANMKDGKLQVVVPKGQSMTLTVGVNGTDLTDTVRIHNPGKLMRWQCLLSQTLEKGILELKNFDEIYHYSATCKLLDTFLALVR